MNIFTIIWSVWFASEILLHRLLRSHSPDDKQRRDKGSLRLIWMMIALAIFLANIFINYVKIPISKQPIVPYSGLLIIILGMILRFYSIWSLGRLFTVNITIRAGHQLKKDGIYKVIRHPSYSGSLLSFTGFGISLNNWLSLLSVIVLVTIAFLYRIKTEEKLLTDQFGGEYTDYKRNTYCLIPWIY